MSAAIIRVHRREAYGEVGPSTAWSKVPYSTQGHRTSATNSMEHSR